MILIEHTFIDVVDLSRVVGVRSQLLELVHSLDEVLDRVEIQVLFRGEVIRVKTALHFVRLYCLLNSKTQHRV